LIYLDTSVLLARLFAEDRAPPDALWAQALVASRLLEYEVYHRVHARGAQATHGVAARELLERVNLLAMSTEVLGRALLPFAQPVRTPGALHLATMVFLRSRGLALALATYDQRLAAAAAGEGFEVVEG
jgi:predicted nucleic acid-binding protein